MKRSQKVLRQQMRPPTVADEVGRLAVLHDRGQISAEEFEAAKRQVLQGRARNGPQSRRRSASRVDNRRRATDSAIEPPLSIQVSLPAVALAGTLLVPVPPSR